MGKLISKVQRKGKKQWRAKSVLPGCLEAWGQPGWDYGRWSVRGRGCDRKGVWGSGAKLVCKALVTAIWAQSAERLIDLALRLSYLETLHFVKFLQSLDTSILILEDGIEPIFLFFVYYHQVIISSASDHSFPSEFIGYFFAPGCSTVYSFMDTQSRSLKKMHFECSSSCKFHIEGGKTKLEKYLQESNSVLGVLFVKQLECEPCLGCTSFEFLSDVDVLWSKTGQVPTDHLPWGTESSQGEGRCSWGRWLRVVLFWERKERKKFSEQWPKMLHSLNCLGLGLCQYRRIEKLNQLILWERKKAKIYFSVKCSEGFRKDFAELVTGLEATISGDLKNSFHDRNFSRILRHWFESPGANHILRVSSLFCSLSCVAQSELNWKIAEWSFQEERSFSMKLFLSGICDLTLLGRVGEGLGQAASRISFTATPASQTHIISKLLTASSSLHLSSAA